MAELGLQHRAMPKLVPSFRQSLRWTATEARDALIAEQASGLSRREFATQQGLDPQRLRLWERKLTSRTPSSAGPAFIEVAARTVEPVEIALPSGGIRPAHRASSTVFAAARPC